MLHSGRRLSCGGKPELDVATRQLMRHSLSTIISQNTRQPSRPTHRTPQIRPHQAFSWFQNWRQPWRNVIFKLKMTLRKIRYDVCGPFPKTSSRKHSKNRRNGNVGKDILTAWSGQAWMNRIVMTIIKYLLQKFDFFKHNVLRKSGKCTVQHHVGSRSYLTRIPTHNARVWKLRHPKIVHYYTFSTITILAPHQFWILPNIGILTFYKMCIRDRPSTTSYFLCRSDT